MEKTDTQAACPHRQLSRAHVKSYTQRCLYKEQKAPCALPGRDSHARGICLLVSSGWLPTISSSSSARTCTSLRCSPPHVQMNVEHKGNSIPKSTKRFQQDDQGRQRSYPLGPLLITGTGLHTTLDIRAKGIKSQRQSLSRPALCTYLMPGRWSRRGEHWNLCHVFIALTLCVDFKVHDDQMPQGFLLNALRTQ